MSKGLIRYICVTSCDFNKKMNKQPENRFIDEHFKLIADHAPVMIWISGLDKGCYYFNNTWLAFTGRTFNEEYGNGWAEGIHPDDFEQCVTTYHTNFVAQKPFKMTYRLRRHDGEYRWLLDHGVPHYTPDGKFLGFIGSCVDVHEQRRLNERLEQKVAERTAELSRQKDFSEMFFNHAIDMMMVYDTEKTLLAANRAARKMYRIGDADIGRNLTEIFPGVENTPGYVDLENALAGETVFNASYRSPITHLYYENYLIPIFNGRTTPEAVLVVARDISEKLNSEHELKKLNDRLVHQNEELKSSNEDLSSFAYIASHDLQEPLRKVSMFSSRILERDGEQLSSQSIEYFDRINGAISRMQNLIQALLNYSRTGDELSQFEKVDLNTILEEVQINLDEIILEKNALVTVGQLPVIRAVPLQMQQLFHNLLTNALKYSRPDVDPRVEINCELTEVPGRDNAKFYKISVADNGIGFDEQFKNKIFELFQRLHGKTEYEGTGIGLAICRKIVNIHNGFINATSTPGEGSTFEVFLPVTK